MRVAQAETELTTILLQRHQISDPTQADFQLQSQQDILNQANSIATALTLCARSHRRHIPGRRRDRNHEHHAGHRHGADTRDRDSQGDRREVA